VWQQQPAAEIDGVSEHQSVMFCSDEARRGLVRFLHWPPRDTLLRMEGGGLFCAALKRKGRASARAQWRRAHIITNLSSIIVQGLGSA
jgi:hypothetical protein